MFDLTCLNPVAFNTASAAWTDAVAREESLLHYFQDSSENPPPLPAEKLQYVTFSVQDMIALVSTVGVRYIRAQFILLPTPLGIDTSPRFTVVLYALDSLKCRISAYFAGNVTMEAMKPSKPSNGNDGAVPFDLVQTWLKAWQTLPDVKSDMFGTNYGPLQGYIFDLRDFIDPLFPPMSDPNLYELRVYFGLHCYKITSGSNVESDETVGLVLSVQKKETARLPLRFNRNKSLLLSGNTDQVADGDDGYYDLSHPNPPGMAATS